MVTFQDIQTAYYMVAATGVLVAAGFYILNLRETTKNRQATLTNSMTQYFTSKEFPDDWLKLLRMKWDSFEDFQRKYDSEVNSENFALRIKFWNLCNSIDYQYRSGLIDIESVYNVAGGWITLTWSKFEPVIREYRKSDFSSDSFKNFEYLADALRKISLRKRGVDETQRVRKHYGLGDSFSQ